MDSEGLNVLTSDMDLRKQGLVLPHKDVLIYPHQFLRRFYSANFVNILTLLEKCRSQGLEVRLRIDPFRATQPKFYQDVFEADYWQGVPFDQSVFFDGDAKPKVAVHGTRADDQIQNATWPLTETIFRTDMSDHKIRQFAIEEYASSTSPLGPRGSVPGIGERFAIQKFAHFEFDQSARAFTHLDCAIRVFELAAYSSVLDSICDGEVPEKHIGHRYKLFKVCGLLNFDIIQELLFEFFMYNPHLQEYFSPYSVNERNA